MTKHTRKITKTITKIKIITIRKKTNQNINRNYNSILMITKYFKVRLFVTLNYTEYNQ